MTRNLLAVAAAMAMLGSGYTPSADADNWGEGAEKVRQARAAEEKEQRALHQRMAERRQARIRAGVEAEQRQAAEFEMLRNGIEPTTGHPLSRQRRRALERQGYRFASGIAAPLGVETGNTGSTAGKSPTGEAGDAQ